MVTRKTDINPDVADLDFSDLRPRGGGRRAHVPEGDYLLEVTDAKQVAIKSGRDAGKPQVAWQFKIVQPSAELAHVAEARKGVGDAIYLNTGAFKESKGLFFLRNLIDDLMADKLAGNSTTGQRLKFTLPDKIGLRVGATLVDGDKYEGNDGEERISSEIKYTFPASKFKGAADAASAGTEDAESDEEDEEEAPAPKPAPKARSNGAAAAQAAAEAVSTADEEEDIEELPVTSL